jgi:anti-sigma factor ChrR (cupin superfamily)
MRFADAHPHGPQAAPGPALVNREARLAIPSSKPARAGSEQRRWLPSGGRLTNLAGREPS